LVDRSRAGLVTGQVCIVGPAKHSRQPRVVYMPISSKSSGPARPVPATISRASSRELTASFLPSDIGLAYRPLHWQVISSLRAAACAPPAPGARGCFALYPAKPDLLKLHVPVLVGCVPSGPSLVYQGSSRGREIALTFDDGPWYDPPTLDFLRVLEREQVPATFFEVGRQIAGYDRGGAIEKLMLADGDMIGDHTWSHPNMARLRPAAQRAQLLKTLAAIRDATGGFTPCLWRPPYGAISPSLVRLARSLGLLTVMWNVDPRDWSLPGAGAIYSNVVTNAGPGAIVIQHFGGGPRFQTLAALPREIVTLRRRGYRFVTVTQLLGLRLVYR
jgi:peptidoglycan/xylan/chitin deacetylase (PgdA/CDA1 family)